MKEAPQMARVSIFRFEPQQDDRPRFQTYHAPFRGLTVLQVLQHIYDQEDPTLAFRYGCNGNGPARCGACVVEVNDVPVLSCQQSAEEEMVIKPHRKYRVVRDLVVDFEAEGGTL